MKWVLKLAEKECRCIFIAGRLMDGGYFTGSASHTGFVSVHATVPNMKVTNTCMINRL